MPDKNEFDDINFEYHKHTSCQISTSLYTPPPYQKMLGLGLVTW